MQALFVLAFVLALRETPSPRLARPAAALRPGGADRGRLRLHLQLPGPDLAGGTAVIWAMRRESALVAGSARRARPRPGALAPRPALGLALLAFVVLVAPEIGRMVDFHSFETFDPNGPGLGNLFGQISPFEALGIWPSGDFRLAPGRRRGAGARLLPRRRLRARPPALRRSSAAGAAARPRSSPASPPPRSPTPPPASAARPTPPPRRSRSPRRSSPWRSSCPARWLS